jgi:hypothetical protein
MDLNAVRSALAAVKDAYMAEESVKESLAAATEERANAIKALHALTEGTPIKVEGHTLTTVTEGGKGGKSAFLRGAAEWLGLDRKVAKTSKPREIISL